MTGEDKQIRLFRTFEEAEAADRDFYRSLTPEQRLNILLELIARNGSSKGLERVYRIVEFERR